jgi:hypothetical protein
MIESPSGRREVERALVTAAELCEVFRGEKLSRRVGLFNVNLLKSCQAIDF